MKKLSFLLSLILLVPATPFALEDQSVSWIHWIQPKPGMEREFEQAVKAHHRWRGEQGDSWAWLVWRITTGTQTGMYAIATFNHRWADFDAPPVSPTLAMENYRDTVGPYVQSIRTEHYVHHADISNVPADLPPREFSITEMIEVEVGKERQFFDSITKIDRAIKETGWPNYYEWYELDYGGRKPTFARVRLLWRWDDLTADERSLRDVLEQAYGRREAAAIAEAFNQSVSRRYNRTAVLQRELFYIPSAS